MHKFYMAMDGIREKVEARAHEELHGRQLTRTEIIPHWLKVAKAMWAEEPEAVREEVKAAAAKSYELRLEAYKAASVGDDMSAEQCEELRANIVSAMQPWIEEVLRVTKCPTAMFVVGVPPTEGRPKVRTIAVEVGSTSLANGSKTYKQLDPEGRRAFLFSFAGFTSKTAEALAQGHIDVEPPSAAGDNDDPLNGMFTLESDIHEFDVEKEN
ncbi:hypothetical protein HDZ31DRAFT_69203, partial [Schizophyllum fasciatum]